MCKAFIRKCCCVVHGFVLCVVSVWNRCLSTPLRKLTQSEGSLHPQRFLRPPRPKLEPEISRTATACSSHSTTEAPQFDILIVSKMGLSVSCRKQLYLIATTVGAIDRDRARRNLAIYRKDQSRSSYTVYRHCKDMFLVLQGVCCFLICQK